jgi:hypothetical protein
MLRAGNGCLARNEGDVAAPAATEIIGAQAGAGLVRQR